MVCSFFPGTTTWGTRVCVGPCRLGARRLFHSIASTPQVRKAKVCVYVTRWVQQVTGCFDDCMTHFSRELMRGMVEVRPIRSRCTASTTARHSAAPILFSSGKVRLPQTEKDLCFRKSPSFLSQRTLQIWCDTSRRRVRQSLVSFDQ